MTVAALCKLAALPPNNKGVDMNLIPGFPKQLSETEIWLSLPALGQAK